MGTTKKEVMPRLDDPESPDEFAQLPFPTEAAPCAHDWIIKTPDGLDYDNDRTMLEGYCSRCGLHETKPLAAWENMVRRLCEQLTGNQIAKDVSGADST